ncbi:MAG: hypothetical protein GY862_29160 [Gammaproteobacteria bacterium]|nr:hypothetical protein [Gammaproteobacteria bacterium]
MKYRFFCIPALNPREAEEELDKFCSEHRVVSMEKQFVSNGERSFWSICACYFFQNNRVDSKKSKIDYREVLNEKDFALYAKLRVLRKEIAERENNVPLYALFTNEQLAEMVQKRVSSLAAQGDIDGVGKARLDKYGQPFIALIQKEISANRTMPDPAGAGL